jgi:hypothetical protein
LAIATAVTLYSVRWSYAAIVVLPPGLVLLVVSSVLARRAAPGGKARGGFGDVAASLGLGLIAASFAGGYAFYALYRGDDPREWAARCGVVQPEQFWRIAKASAVLSVPLAVVCVAGPPAWRLWKRAMRAVPQARRVAGSTERLNAGSWIDAARVPLTLAYLTLGALLLPVTCVQIATEFMRGIGAAEFLLWPALCAACWTAGAWALDRPATGAARLRMLSAVALAAGVAGSTLTADSDPVAYDVIACEAPLGLGSWHLLRMEALGGLYLAFAALAAIAMDPDDARARAQQP